MSSADYERDATALRSLIGRDFRLVAATNSLKLLFDPTNHRRSYLWIDPPWVLEGPKGEIVADSADCPRENEPFRSWARALDPIHTGRVRAVDHRDGCTTLELDGGWCLCMEPGELDDDDQWYDDFYWQGE